MLYLCPLCLNRGPAPGSCEACEAELIPDPTPARVAHRHLLMWPVLILSFVGVLGWFALAPSRPPLAQVSGRPCALCDGAGWVKLSHDDYILCLSCDGTPGGLCSACRSKGWQHRMWYDRAPCPTCGGGR
jgi:hypothetical protein